MRKWWRSRTAVMKSSVDNDDDDDDDDDEVVVSIYSDIIGTAGDNVWDEVLAEIQLMKEEVATFQVGLNQLKNAVEIPS